MIPGKIISGRFRYTRLFKPLANGWKYRLIESVTFDTGIIPQFAFRHDFIRFEKTGHMTLKTGYQWNGASGPCPDHQSIMAPSCLHDALCQMYAMGAITKDQRCQADYLLAIMTKANMLEYARKIKNVILRPVRVAWAHVWPECVYMAVRGYTCIQ